MRFVRDCILALALASVPLCALAARTDTVLLINGNTITGEVETYDFGKLEYSTDSMGTVNIDWEDIVTITSNRSLQVEVVDGTRYFGHLEAADERFHLNVITPAGPVQLSMRRIISNRADPPGTRVLSIAWKASFHSVSIRRRVAKLRRSIRRRISAIAH